MTELAIAVDADDELWTLDNLPTPEAPYVEVESELVEVRSRFPSSYYTLTGETLPPRIRVRRGIAGTTAASHLSGATLTPNYGLGGGVGGGGVTVATVTLTDAQIKALPTTPVVIIPATEVLDYAGMPTTLPVPATTIVNANVWATGYGNISAGEANRFGVFFGSDAGNGPAATDVFNTDLADTFGHFYILGPSAKGIEPSGSRIEGSLINLADGLLDNALVFWAVNPAGDFTGGDPANTLKVTVFYTVLTL